MAKAADEQYLFGTGMLQNPFPVYKQLRDEEPVHWNDKMQAWVVTGYADVTRLMKDRRFSSDRVSKARQRYA
ncbi:MAG: hypothetical protein AAGC96_07245, partial [Pseudomonadota bacterium]